MVQKLDSRFRGNAEWRRERLKPGFSCASRPAEFDKIRCMKSVAVIIPTWNRRSVICSAIDSVLAQSYKLTQCIVVDDASTDGTAAFLRAQYMDDVKVISCDKNQGQSACRNTGVESTECDYVCFLDSDDVLDTHAVESRINALSEVYDDTISASFGVMRYPGKKSRSRNLITQKKRGEKLQLSEYLQNGDWCSNNGYLINRCFFVLNGMYDTRLRNHEDTELLLRLLSKSDFVFCGEEIGKVNKSGGGGIRARNSYDTIIRQGTLFSEIIAANPDLRLEHPDIHSLICSDTGAYLRALYKSHQYSEFRLRCKKALRDKHILDTGKFCKRYILSYARQVVATLSKMLPYRR